MAQLDYLIKLKDGWDGPDSRAISPVAISNYICTIQALEEVHEDFDEPMGTTSGGIRLELSRDDLSMILEYEFDGTVWLYSERDGKTIADRTIAFDVQKVTYFVENGELCSFTDVSQAVLDTPVFIEVKDSPTIGDLLTGILAEIWVKKEGFDPTCPLGDPDWRNQIYRSLARAGFFKYDGEASTRIEAENLVYQAIAALYKRPGEK